MGGSIKSRLSSTSEAYLWISNSSIYHSICFIQKTEPPDFRNSEVSSSMGMKPADRSLFTVTSHPF